MAMQHTFVTEVHLGVDECLSIAQTMVARHQHRHARLLSTPVP